MAGSVKEIRERPTDNENYQLAHQYMEKYFESLVVDYKDARENKPIYDKIEKLEAELSATKKSVIELKQQNKMLATRMQYYEKYALRSQAALVKSTSLPAPLETAVQVPADTQKPKNKTFVLISNIVFYICMAALILGAVAFAQSDNVDKSLFGFRYYYIKTSSMEPVLPVGSVVFTKVTEAKDIKVGDDITVYVQDGQGDTYLTHRVVEIIKDDETGELSFRTKGVNNKANDPIPFSEKMLTGKVVLCIPVLGKVMTFVQSQLILVVVIFILLLGLSFMLRLLFSKPEETANGTPTELKGKKKITIPNVNKISEKLLEKNPFKSKTRAANREIGLNIEKNETGEKL